MEEIFGEIGLKPTLQASRVDKSSKTKTKRPIKVSLSSTNNFYYILSKARKLHQSENFSCSSPHVLDSRARARALKF